MESNRSRLEFELESSGSRRDDLESSGCQQKSIKNGDLNESICFGVNDLWGY